MSVCIVVTLTDPFEAASMEAMLPQEVEARLRKRCPQELGSKLRVVVRKECFGVSIEPFWGSGSLMGLVSTSRRKDVVDSILEATVAELALLGRTVGIAVADEPVAWKALTKRSCSIDTALRSLARSRNQWFQIEPLIRVFYIGRVEAVLLKPLPLVGSSDKATRYFRDYWVASSDEAAARQVVVSHLLEDGAAFVTCARPEVVDAPTVDVFNGASAGVVRVGGRVYFSET